MLEAALVSAGLHRHFDVVLSADQVQAFKTDPSVYALGPQALKRPAAEILFVSSNAWDACGATWYGYTTCWVNRAGLPPERLGIRPHRIGADLTAVTDLLLKEHA
jgi:2-haloacid dehalogenase